ncbi:MAG: peptide chain release factor N(5)-glutamine methyltransferase [Pirellulaceae bacterium]
MPESKVATMNQPQPWTIGRLLQWTTDYLKQHGSSSPRLDAELLLAKSLDRPRIELYTGYQDDPGDEVRSSYRELVRRRAAGEPVAYLVGRREFYSLSFEVTTDVLIPRPETEFVVMALLDAIKASPANDHPWRIADVGTGSGVLAICAAKHVSTAQVTAIDISPPALEVARRNARAHDVADRIEWIEGDLLTSLSEDPRFDFIVSNPPYVSQAELEQTPREVQLYEPHSALVAGPTGDEIIARLVPQAASRLVGGGALITEISPMLEQRILQLLQQDDRFEEPNIVKDLSGHSRVIVTRRRKE